MINKGERHAYKIVFFDIDGTLVNDEKKIPLDTKEAVRQLKEQGIEVVIATGRAPYHLKHISNELGIDSFVSFNGSYVVHKGQLIYHRALKRSALESLEEIAGKQGHPIVYLSSEACYANKDLHPYVIESFKTLRLPVPAYHSCYWKERNIYQALLYCEEHEEGYYDGLISDFDLIRWHKYSIDVLPAGGSKAKGIAEILNLLGLSPAEAVAFGDGLNDKEMLSYVGMGIAMGNAHEEVKPFAKFITKPINDGGIKFALEQIQLI